MNCLSKEFQEKVDLLLTLKNEATTDKAKPKIQRVPAIMRSKTDSNSDSEKYYEPRWMSIGPIHHGNPKFQLAEKYKLELAAKFIREGGYTAWQSLYDETKEKLQAVKDRFEDEIEDKDNNHRLALILFFDGCAVLQFILSCSVEGRFDELKLEMKMKNDLVAFTTRDLFLLENQIPFRMLEILIETRPVQDRGKLKEAIESFVSNNTMAPAGKEVKAGLAGLEEPAHLLDLLLSALIRKTEKKSLADRRKQGCKFRLCGLIRSDLEHQGSSASERNTCSGGREMPKEQQSFRSVKDLKASGIDFKPSETSSLRDISFTSLRFAGILKLPPLVVDDSTGSKFMNLIAYEMCPDNTETEYEITSYVAFLDSLIDYPVDVKELRSAQILHNLLGCDKELAALFNKIATDLVPNQEVYKRVIDRIERHYKSAWMTWMAQVYSEHFSSPWTIVTFIAAVVAIGMAGIQTWFTVYSVEGPCDSFCHHLKKL